MLLYQKPIFLTFLFFMTQVLNFANGSPSPSPSDCDNLDNSRKFDFIVVGGGAGGAVVANRLAEVKKWKVLLLEAGGDAPLDYNVPLIAAVPDPAVWAANEWDFKSAPSDSYCLSYKNGQCNYRRAKDLGGCTTNNFMMYVRGNPVDYDEWEKMGNPGWSYNDVLPYFKKSELFLAYPITPNPANNTVGSKYHGKLGPWTVNSYNHDPATHLIRNGLFEAANEMGYQRNLDYCGESQIGFSDIYSTIDMQGYRETTAKAFLSYPPKNLLICKGSIVNRVIIHKKVVKGVEVSMGKRRRSKIYAKKEVILSAGAFGTPGILERSGVGSPRILKKLGIGLVHHLPGVGENLQDHNFLPGNIYKVNFRSSAPQDPLTMSLTSFGGFINTFENSSVPDIQFVFFAFPRGSPLIETMGKSLNWNEKINQKNIVKGLFNDLICAGPTLLKPKSRGSVHIRDKDPESEPEIIPNYFKNQDDVDTMTRGMRFMDNMLNTKAFSYYEPEYVSLQPCGGIDLKTDVYYECVLRHASGTLYHPSCSCPMGPDNDPMAVVNNRLQIYGLGNVRIADASVFPLIPRGNTQAPTVMVGEKAADMIKEDYGIPINTFTIEEA